jgi:hypothetical protein
MGQREYFGVNQHHSCCLRLALVLTETVGEQLMDDRYDVAQIRDYLRLLQEYSPHAAGMVLT